MDPDPGRYVMMLARTVVAQDEIRSRANLEELDQVVKYVSHMPGLRTVILVSPGFLSQSEQFQLDQIIDQALRSEIVISSLDAKGLVALTRELDVSQSSGPSGAVMAAAHGMDMDREFVATDVLSEVAQGTGGRFFHGDNDLKSGFGTLAGSSVSYILAFAPADVRQDGKFHEVGIRLTQVAHTDCGLALAFVEVG